MTTYIEHAADGRILQATECEEAPPASFGGTVVQVEGSVDASRTLYQGGEVVLLPPQPSMMHIIDPVAREWVMPGMTSLETAQSTKWGEIRDERDRRERDVFPYLGQWLQCDVVSVLRMAGAKEAAAAALAAGVEFSETWTCEDNSLLPMTAHDVLGMLPALALWSSSLHATGRELRALIDACETVEEVAAISWPA